MKCVWRNLGAADGYFQRQLESGHIEKSSLRKQHTSAVKEATRLLQEQSGSKTLRFENFDLYSLRHTCLTRWAPHMDPWTLMRLAGHRDMATTMRYIHPEDDTTRQAMQRARDAVDRRRVNEAVGRARLALEKSQGRDKIRDSENEVADSRDSLRRIN